MAKHIDYSNDLVEWHIARSFEVGSEYTYMRYMEEFDKNWDRQKIFDVLEQAVTKKSRIEYSQDGGFSWVPLRTQRLPEDAARVSTMLQRNYGVRILQITNMKEGKSMTGGMIERINSQINPQYHATPQQKRPPRVDTVSVYLTDDSKYVFSKLAQKLANAELISRITHTTYYDMRTPNENRVAFEGLDRSLAAQGYIFRIRPFSEIAAEFPDWQAVLNLPLEADYMLCQCARTYDATLDAIFATDIEVHALLGGKYAANRYNASKLGDTWIFPKSQLATVLHRIEQSSCYIEALSKPKIHQEAIQVNHLTGEFTPEYIMTIRTQLAELISVGDNETLTDALFNTIEYRDKCVDEIRELNKVITQAKEKLMAAYGSTT